MSIIPNKVEKKFEDNRPVYGKEECWPWAGAKTSNGYGLIAEWNAKKYPKVKYKGWYTHRISFALHYGYLPQTVLHSCDNPSCCNPNHLIGGTVLDNVRDMISKRRHSFGSRHPNSKMTEKLVRDLRKGKLTCRQVADISGANITTVEKAKRGATWKCA